MGGNKSQITNHKLQTNSNDLNSKYQTGIRLCKLHLQFAKAGWLVGNYCRCFGHWVLEFEIYLVFDICDLEFQRIPRTINSE